MPGNDREEAKRQAARETMDILHEISTLLGADLDRRSLTYCVSLIENGVSPDALARVVIEMRARYGAEGLAKPSSRNA